MIWRAVVGLEGRYEVSEDGRVRNAQTGLVLRPRLDTDGYLLVTRVGLKVHRLVLEAFVGPAPLGAPEVDHINRQRADNRLENLRWVSRSTNLRNTAVRNGSGLRGVRYRAGRASPWQAYARHAGRFRALGCHKTADAALQARVAFDMEHGYV